MRKLLVILGAGCLCLAFWLPRNAMAQGAECPGGLCGTPNQSGGGCGCGCGSVLVAMTDRGDTYQFADDFDGDGIEDEFDNCPFKSNYDQADADGDVVGDSCDLCVTTQDPLQSDIDADGMGDLCDGDMDGDGKLNGADDCQAVPNADQKDTDLDQLGDACDPDDDNDGTPDLEDGCRLAISAQDGPCDDDPDGDGFPTNQDNCPYIYNPDINTQGDQMNMDGDVLGDACDLDIDGDAVPNVEDNCSRLPNPSQLDLDRDGLGDAGNWSGGAESCDTKECYVISGDAQNCLDPNTAFTIYLSLVGDLKDGKFQTGQEVTVGLFSNRLGKLHTWTTRFSSLPGDSEATLKNAKGSGETGQYDPHVKNCLRTENGVCTEVNNIRFTPDQPGEYAIKVTASLPQEDALGPSTATYTIMAQVEGEGKGGCAASSGGLAALALGLFLLGWRRKR